MLGTKAWGPFVTPSVGPSKCPLITSVDRPLSDSQGSQLERRREPQMREPQRSGAGHGVLITHGTPALRVFLSASIHLSEKCFFCVILWTVKEAGHLLSPKILGESLLASDPSGSGESGVTLGPSHGLRQSRGLKIAAGPVRARGPGGQSEPANLLTHHLS